MKLSFLAQRVPYKSTDQITARHVCSAHSPVLSLIRIWFRKDNGTWDIPSDANELDFYCPRCGEPYPTSEEIEYEYQKQTFMAP